MNTRSAVVITLAVVLAISALCVWFVPSLQDFMAGNTMWNGVRTFLSDSKAQQATSLSILPADSKGAVFIAVPYIDYSTDDLAKLQSFLLDGGTVVLADDFGYGNHLLEYLGVTPRFDTRPLLDPLFSYRNQWMPKITDFPNPHDFQVVVLNHATTLLNVDASDVVAWSSATSYIDVNRSEVWNDDEPKGPFPVAAKLAVGQGTLVLASDASLMINSMINYADNYAFVNYLMGLGGDVKSICFDVSHLSATPLDVSKGELSRVKQLLGTPYPLLAVMAAAFALVARWMLHTGGPIERQPTDR
jgi:hypothetical protein